MKGAIVQAAAKLLGFGLLFGIASPSQAATVEYIHTDALGSPVAVTDSNGVVIERREYEPYGRQLAPTPVKDGPGYTGHVSDAATGLDYMQQRYYDPQIGRFLSVDPVVVNSDTGGNFNRYRYANDNPYKFTDPDGRVGELVAAGCGITIEIGCAPGAIAGGIIEGLIYVAAAVAIASPVIVNNDAPSPDGGNTSSGASSNGSTDAPKISDRPAGPDGKSGSTGGPGAGKRFGRESPQTKAKKEGAPCRYCDKQTTNKPGQPNSRERDHIDPKSRGGNNSPENEGDSCRTCNRQKGARSPDEWQKK